MPKYQWIASYTVDGAKGLMKDGGSARREAVAKMIDSVGGRLESFYYAFGGDDVYVVADMPDNEAAAAAAIAVSASGAVSLKTVVLLTAEQIDAAVKHKVGYRPPGG